MIIVQLHAYDGYFTVLQNLPCAAAKEIIQVINNQRVQFQQYCHKSNQNTVTNYNQHSKLICTIKQSISTVNAPLQNGRGIINNNSNY